MSQMKFYKWYAGFSDHVDMIVQDTAAKVSEMFEHGFVEFTDNDDDFMVDLNGVVPNNTIPYTVSLNPGRSPQSVIDQIEYERKSLLSLMYQVSSETRLLSGGAAIKWTFPLTTQIIMPPTVEELIKWRGMSAGYSFTDNLTHPALLISGRVSVRGFKLQ